MEQEPIDLKKGFFKKAKLSILNIEKYPELATEGVPRAISYLSKMVAILTVVICIGMICQTTQVVSQVVGYIESEMPEFSYQDGNLDVKSQEPITIDNDTIGKIIIDTKAEEQEKVNQYTNQIIENGNGVLLLKDKIVIRNSAVLGTETYKYDEILSQMGLTSFEKQDVINYARGTQMISIYISLFVVIFIYAFIIYFLNTIVNTLLISAFGYLANLFTKVKMRYAAIFNMSIYSITLSMILNIIYVIINMFIDFNIEYFDVMYISVAVIYLFAAIFMLKADLQKRQMELMKIVEVQEQVKKEMEEKEAEEKKKQNEKPKEEPKGEPKEDNEKKEKKDGKEKKGNVGKSGPTPEGTGA